MSAEVRRVVTGGSTHLELHLVQEERELLATLAEQLHSLLNDVTDADDDPAIDRLFPSGYRDDPAAADEFRQYTRAALVDHKLTGAARLAALGSGSGVARLELAEAAAVLPALTDLRLVLAERLGIRDEMHEPEGMMAEVYHWLGALQWNLVTALDETNEGTAHGS